MCGQMEEEGGYHPNSITRFTCKAIRWGRGGGVHQRALPLHIHATEEDTPEQHCEPLACIQKKGEGKGGGTPRTEARTPCEKPTGGRGGGTPLPAACANRTQQGDGGGGTSDQQHAPPACSRQEGERDPPPKDRKGGGSSPNIMRTQCAGIKGHERGTLKCSAHPKRADSRRGRGGNPHPGAHSHWVRTTGGGRVSTEDGTERRRKCTAPSRREGDTR